jgi:hypothetical protein
MSVKSVPLVRQLEYARMENFAGPSAWSSWDKIDFARGGAASNLPPYVPFQGGGSTSGQAILVIPPGRSGYDFVRLSFFNVNLDPAHIWSFETRIGIQQQVNNRAAGVRFKVVVIGDRKQPFARPGIVLYDRTIERDQVVDVEVPLGLWPLLANFEFALQVEKVGTNNQDQKLLIDDPRLTTTASKIRPRLGIARANLVWERAPEMVVSEIADAGSVALRTDLRATLDGVSMQRLGHVIRRANERGMRVLINIMTDPEDYVDWTSSLGPTAGGGRTFLELCGWDGGAPRISQVDLGRYRQRLVRFLEYARSTYTSPPLAIEAFEIGNEYDWACFNGDIPLDTFAGTAIMAPFALKYAAMLGVSREVVRTYLPTAKIITFGMANIAGDGRAHSADWVIFPLLKNANGIDAIARYADGIGEHLYIGSYGADGSLNPRVDLAEGRLHRARALLGDSFKPFWVTELGYHFAVGKGRIPVSSEARYLAFEALLSKMNDLTAQGIPVAAVYIYSWDDDRERYGIKGRPEASFLQDYR